MNQSTKSFFSSKTGMIVTGLTIGVIGSTLQKFGNPKNMGVCVACFERDIAGALGLHRAAAVQYLRPEIFGFVLGAFIAALLFKEYRSRGGSSPIIRFVLGFFAMIGALAFLGCPWRAWFRLAGGDFTAIVGLLGLTVGILIGIAFLKKGFSLGRSYKLNNAAGWVMPVISIALLLFAIFKPLFGAENSGPIFSSESGPGSMHAPLIISLIAGLLIGFLAQRTRFCTVGAVRDIALLKDYHLGSGVLALFVGALVMNLIYGQFNPGYSGQPIAHSNLIWNFMGMLMAGLAYSLAGGCPGRQLFLSGEGDTDAGIFVIGMVAGAAFSHNFGLAGTPDAMNEGVLVVGGISQAGMIAVIIGLVVCLVIGFTMREKAA